MNRGFYELGSTMLTKGRQMSVISNNVANVKTPGFKKDDMTDRTFGDLYIHRVEDLTNPLENPLEHVNTMRVADTIVTDFTQGNMEETQRTLDFGITGDGFFAVQGAIGTVYTRNGSFNIDDEGYLTLKHIGRVLGTNGQPIQVGTDQIFSDNHGNITVGGQAVGSLGVYNFADTGALLTVGEGMYQGANATPVQNPNMQWQYIESSNVNMAREMTDALSAQRTLQNCSTTLKMIDQMNARATTEIAKI